MRILLPPVALLLAFATGLLVAPFGAAPAAGAADDRGVELLVRNPTGGRLTHGYVHIHDTDEWIPILGTPDDDHVQEPLERQLVTRVPYGVRLDLIAYGHDTDLDRPGTWESTEHYVRGRLQHGQYTITLGHR